MAGLNPKFLVAFFKLDVEGFEMPIIQGAKKLFKSRLVELCSRK
jgi:hypothetical protein